MGRAGRFRDPTRRCGCERGGSTASELTDTQQMRPDGIGDCRYACPVRNTKAFRDAVQSTVAELERHGIPGGPVGVADLIERNITALSLQMKISPAAALKYFDPAALANSLAEVAAGAAASGELQLGEAPYPPFGNPELALIMAGIPDLLVQTGGDLFAVFQHVAVTAWMAGHIHGEDGCPGCDRKGTPGGHDWNARMAGIAGQDPRIARWLTPEVWNRALESTGFSLEQ